MKKNRGIVHILIIIIGVGLMLVLLGFFNSVEKNWKIQQKIESNK
ncbi:MAG: hypothetical protein WCX46_02605 [Candidatus Paceibacterota bacterium]